MVPYWPDLSLAQYLKLKTEWNEPIPKKDIVNQMIETVKLVHSKNICHRNLNIDNFRINHADFVSLTNFNLAQEGEQPYTFYSIPQQVYKLESHTPPEVLKYHSMKKSNQWADLVESFRQDLWDLGVCILQVLMPEQ